MRAELGLSGSSAIGNTHTLQEQEQLVINRVDEDLSGRHGVRTIMAELAFKDGVHIPRRVVADVMHRYYPDGFAQRAPGGKQIRRVAKHPLGPHERWSCDGHDKLNSIGIQIYSIVDDATGKRLGQWVVPNNREKAVIAYLYLSLVLECGSELNLCLVSVPCRSRPFQVFRFKQPRIVAVRQQRCLGTKTPSCMFSSLYLFTYSSMSFILPLVGLIWFYINIPDIREFFHPGETDVAPHSYVKSINNIAVERSWRHLGDDWGASAVRAFHAGIDNGDYHEDNPHQQCV